ncbi:MAG: hypothetical protein U0W24_11510 [Bacteroidales bacterium]
MRKKEIITLVFWLCFFNGCAQTNDSVRATNTELEKTISPVKITRTRIIEKLSLKIKNHEALVVHVFVPLCDNKYQGIVKVGAKLGDGRNLKTNLYWGAGYGLKTWFTHAKEWNYLGSIFNPDSSVLERAVYSRKYAGGAEVLLVLDGYKGDKMGDCLMDFFNSLAGKLKDTIVLNQVKMPAFGNADLLVFNGHNGLMDNDYPWIENADGKERDAAVIACASDYYFTARFPRLKAYPLITTTNFLPPEAYIISAIIDNWATLQPGEKIRKSAGEAMAKVHKIAVQPCIKTFKTGW